MKSIFLTLSILFSSAALAGFTSECLNPVAPLKKGEVAQCTGYLFSKLTEAQARHTIVQVKLIQQELEILIQQNSDLKEEITNYAQALAAEQKKSKEWQDTALKYSTKYEETQSNRATRDALFFAAGIGFTIVAGIGIVWILTHLGVGAFGATAAGAAK